VQSSVFNLMLTSIGGEGEADLRTPTRRHAWTVNAVRVGAALGNSLRCARIAQVLCLARSRVRKGRR